MNVSLITLCVHATYNITVDRRTNDEKTNPVSDVKIRHYWRFYIDSDVSAGGVCLYHRFY